MLPNKKNATKKLFWISAFYGRFLTKKQPNLTENKENWQNPNRLKFSVIWYVDASKRRRMLQKNVFDLGIYLPFLAKKQTQFSKNEENWQNPNR